MTAPQPSRSIWVFCLAAFGLLWLAVVHQFGPQWTILPQYNYGWGVPFLCVYLLWERWLKRPAPETPRFKLPVFALAAVCALVLAFARWAHEANTTWRITTWLMASGAVTISLCGIYLAGGRRWVLFFAFPVCFFLVAVPWPSRVEVAVIQNLMQLNVAFTTELATFAGIPAMQHGNVIEVSRGMVGIDEACSGIRSLQATLMIALFFGELYRLTIGRRLGLVAIGALLAFVFNLGRTFLLVSVAARDGIAAMEKWHDPAGITILVGCFTGLWGAATWLRRQANRTETTAAPKAQTLRPVPPVTFSVALIIWAVSMEVGTELWYRAHETGVASAPQWAARWPASQPQFKEVEISARVRSELNIDEGSSVRWLDAKSRRWQAFFFRWQPASTQTGRVRLQSAKNHRPDVCLPATGMSQRADLGVKLFPAGELNLPFRRYIFEDRSGPLYVFYCFWEDGAAVQGQAQMLESPRSRLAAAVAGVRGLGERMLEVAIDGVKDQAEAEAAFAQLLPEIITAGKP